MSKKRNPNVSANARPFHLKLGDHAYDPAVWQYLSFSRATALDISKGFPEYWQLESKKCGLPISPQEADVFAEKHRAERLVALAQMDSPLPKEFARGLQANLQLKEIPVPVGFKGEQTWSPQGPFYNNVFAVQLEGEKGQDFRNGNAVLSLDAWIALIRLFIMVLTHRHPVPFCDEFLPRIGKHGTTLDDGAIHQGGSRLASQELLIRTSGKSNTHSVRWGPLRYEMQTVFDSHFCVVGKQRTGKTTILKLLFQSIFTDLKEETRFVFYDAKPDLLPSMTRPEDVGDSHTSSELPVYLLDPFDQRSTAWDIAKDATSRTKSEHIADILFGVGSPNEDFFDEAAPIIAAAAMDALRREAGDNWTFYDLITALRPENVEAVLKSSPYGEQEYKTYFQSPTASSTDLMKTLANKTKLLRPVAYAWTHAQDHLSLTDWVNSQTKSIVLSNNDQYYRASKEINRILLDILSKLLLGKENPPARTFLYLDEFENFGYITSLGRIAQQGASRKVNMALALHNLDTLKDLYKQSTEGILGDCAFKAFLSVENRNTTNWASDTIGTQDVLIEQTSSQKGSTSGESTRKDDSTKSESEQAGESVTRIAKTRKLVSPDEISRLPLPEISQAVTGYFMAPGHFPYQGTLPLSKLLCSRSEYLQRRDVEKESNFYALWPKDTSVSESALLSPEKIDSPDDSFATLFALGFKKPGYPPVLSPSTDASLDESESDEPDISHEPKTDPTTEPHQLPTPQPPTALPKKKHNLNDYVWDDELETFRLKTDDD